MAFSILDSRNPLRNAAPLRHVSGREWSDWGDVVIVPFGNDNVAFQLEKDPWKAVEERKIMRRDAGKDPIAAQAMLHAASQPCIGSLLYWINSFAWTYKVLEVDDEGQETAVMDEAAEYPFLTWPAQDKFIASVHDGIRFGQDLIVDKSRAQGASWVILTVFHWFWQYTRNVHFMEMSRVEDLVDSRSGTGQNAGSDDPDTLFWKHDFLIRKQPGFLVPRHRRSRMRLTNDSLQSSIRGRATSPQQGRAGRRTASLIDEAGMIDCLEQIWRSLSRTSPCRIANSTPNGPVYYSKLVRDASAGKRGKLIQLHWSDHPEHGKGRYESTEDDGTIRIRSPWYDEQSTRMTAKDRAQELDLDHFGAGDLFFDKPTIDMQGRFACEPFHTGVIGYDGDDRDEDLRIGGARAIGHLGWVHRSSGHWRLWVDIAPDRHGILRPPQMWTYSIGVDVSYGTGASNSTMLVVCNETGEQVGEFADPDVRPSEFARLAVAAQWWWGGSQSCAFLIWEANGGGGEEFGFEVVKTLSSPWYYRMRDERKVELEDTLIYGWYSNRERKKFILGKWEGAMSHKGFITRSEATVEEQRSYVHFEDGSIGPGHLSELNTVARSNHGDRVIGGALAYYGTEQCWKNDPPLKAAAPGSAREREEQHEADEKARAEGRAPPSERPTWVDRY